MHPIIHLFLQFVKLYTQMEGHQMEVHRFLKSLRLAGGHMIFVIQPPEGVDVIYLLNILWCVRQILCPHAASVF